MPDRTEVLGNVLRSNAIAGRVEVRRYVGYQWHGLGQRARTRAETDCRSRETSDTKRMDPTLGESGNSFFADLHHQRGGTIEPSNFAPHHGYDASQRAGNLDSEHSDPH